MVTEYDRQFKRILGTGSFGYGNKPKGKRSIGVKDKHILYDTAKGRCKNPYCRKKISESEMQIGHKTAYSRGGSTNLRNAVCLCYACNRKQGTDSWEKFLKKQAIAKGQAEPKTSKPKKSRKKRKRTQSLDMWGNPQLKIPKQPKFNWGI